MTIGHLKVPLQRFCECNSFHLCSKDIPGVVYNRLSTFKTPFLDKIIEETKNYMPTTTIMEDLILLDHRQWIDNSESQEKTDSKATMN